MAEPILVAATVHLRGLRPGDPALVDPDDPYIADLLEARMLERETPVADPAPSEADEDA